MKKIKSWWMASVSMMTLFSSLSIHTHVLAKDQDGLTSSSSSEATGTAGVRGGDVMGKAILNATPNPAAVSKMEQRKISQSQLSQFQQQGKIGRGAK